jgi:lipopolysaccharide/colanic/teichoic acid biosynthesis glycosyltransferase
MVSASSNPYKSAALSHTAALTATSPTIASLPGSGTRLSAVPGPSDRPTAAQLIEAQSTSSRVIKRAGDIFFSLAVLGLGSPLFLLLAALVMVSSPGPVFYVQRRIGRGYRDFGCIKFRTMRKGADRMLQVLLEQSPELRREFGKDFKLKADPRITPIGRFLRRSSLDELPQFLNVLRGEMSVVGPRPIVRDELKRYGRRMDEVLAVRPGLTGLWQVSGRNNLRYAERVRMDVAYARHRGFRADLAIILRTVGVILFPIDRGAY